MVFRKRLFSILTNYLFLNFIYLLKRDSQLYLELRKPYTKPIKRKVSNVLKANFFNSGSNALGSLFLLTVIKCFTKGTYAIKNKY